ncbi:hypothetical protein Z945_3622 [Sulfitobacter noctilucae]|nr:hypothetical protein Z945_3622 [Sulfitobacter noctilucae]
MSLRPVCPLWNPKHRKGFRDAVRNATALHTFYRGSLSDNTEPMIRSDVCLPEVSK